MIVVDTNILAYLLIESQQTQLAAAVMKKDSEWLMPPLWRSEMRNVLLQYVRHQKLSRQDAVRIMDGAEVMMEPGERPVNSSRVLLIAATSGCSAYDGEFVSLAEDHGIPLVTADRKLAMKFPKIAVTLEAFAAS